MKRLTRITALKYTALGIFCLTLSVATAACAGFFYAIKNNLYEPDAVISTAFDKFASSMKYGFGVIAVSCLAASVLLLIFVMTGAGYKKGCQKAVLRPVDKPPFEINAAVIGGLIYIAAKVCLSVLKQFGFWNLFIICPSLLLSSLIFAEFFTSAAIRYKTGTLYRNTLVYRICILFRNAYVHFTLIRKVLFVLFPYFAITFITFSYNYTLLVAIWIVITFILLAVAGSCVIFADSLINGAEKIAGGDLNFKINTTGMYSEFKKLGENLNHISDGISKAVNEKTKSERFRTELITNVSHDIKTPLTSIINYVDLLKREDITPEQREEYIGVLERQTAKLKKLITDLVEASKALTGNVTVNLAPTNLCELLNQAEAEYSGKFAAVHLTLHSSIPEEPVTIYADGRLIWRIFDNLLGNVCKYSLPGTRVYIDTVITESSVSVIIKNISKSVLNISSDELTERFVRGDSSRSTEGSGLGLSIASSLAELQNGGLDISVDGDLFKAKVTFGIYTETESK
ncbi:MAG: HAMP domain-containing sensor histidine kinase [Eubacteriales bacterium]|nr:HAMP domain-containing sensor histidine kinase [Eubacteriales bacterium]